MPNKVPKQNISANCEYDQTIRNKKIYMICVYSCGCYVGAIHIEVRLICLVQYVLGFQKYLCHTKTSYSLIFK